MAVLSNLEPAKVFHYFEEISKIPRGSYNTKQISDYLANFAKERNLNYFQDEVNNVVIFGDATPGYEDAPTVLLQGHMDMVCEVASGYDIDMTKEPLRLQVEGDWLSAEGTTLGGDNGIAVAMMLALLDSADCAHPRIECIFTVDEETGLEGAEALDASRLSGHRLINLDSEDEGVITVSCAGGITANTTLPVCRKTVSGKLYKIRLTGLLGGHSGMEIDKEHANANILMGRVLSEIHDKTDFVLNALKGGSADNVICNECNAEIIVTGGEENLAAAVETLQASISAEYHASDPDIQVLCEAAGEVEADALGDDCTCKVIAYLLNTPNGVIAMSMEIKDLPETSLNLGAVALTDNELKGLYAIRSSVKSRQDFVCRRLASFCEVLGGKAEFSLYYPGWEYRADSPLRDICVEVYKAQYGGEEPVIEAIHAGLECGFFAEKLGEECDAVSIGPTMVGVHTPQEKLSISSTERTWKYLLGILAECK